MTDGRTLSESHPAPPCDRTIMYLHGFLSSAKSTKGQYLQARLAGVPHVAYHAIDFNPTVKDFEYPRKPCLLTCCGDGHIFTCGVANALRRQKLR